MVIVDSKMTLKEAVRASLAPPEVLSTLVLLDVEYFGFDDVLHRGQLVIHHELVTDLRSFFTLARELHFPIQSVIPISDEQFNWNDETSCIKNNSSAFNYRTIAGSNELSKHSFGRAFDINPVQNIYIRFDETLNEISRLPEDGIYTESVAGTLTANHPLVQHMKNLGWTWGGDWTPSSGRIDYQHFEKM